MPLPTQTFNQLVEAQVNAILATAQTSGLLDFEQGSILLAAVESNASSVGLWLQAICLQLLAATRAATCVGAQLDTWMADFNLFREGAVPSVGDVTVARFTSTQQAVVPTRVTFETGDGQLSFAVIADEDNPNYSAPLGGYVLLAGTSSISVPVECTTPGASGNVLPDTITVLVTAIPYVDTVTNPLAFTNGKNQETDDEFRARFPLYLQSLSRATLAAIQYAIISVPGVVQYNVTEFEDPNGDPHPGFFYSTIDNGTGNPPAQLITDVALSIDNYRACGIEYATFGPTVVTVDVTLTVTVKPNYVVQDVKDAVLAAITAYINALEFGQPLEYFILSCVAVDASKGVQNISAYTIDGGTVDIMVAPNERLTAGTITVN